MIRPPPSSTLFPYPTLFRSGYASGDCPSGYWTPFALSPQPRLRPNGRQSVTPADRSEEHTSELQSQPKLVCRLLLEKRKTSSRPASRSLEPLSTGVACPAHG